MTRIEFAVFNFYQHRFRRDDRMATALCLFFGPFDQFPEIRLGRGSFFYSQSVGVAEDLLDGCVGPSYFALVGMLRSRLLVVFGTECVATPHNPGGHPTRTPYRAGNPDFSVQ